jgi:thioredoxin 1
MTHPIAVSDADFKRDVEEASMIAPVLVDFWAPWSGPCRMLAPNLDQNADELDGKMTIAKINVDEHQNMAGTLGVMANPTLILFKDGKPVETIIGFQPKNKLMEKIQGHLN